MSALGDALRPRQPQTVSSWADQHRILAGKGSAEPGRWRTSRTPYLREIMDALSPSTPYTDVWVMKGAQLGFTEVGINWVLWNIASNPGPAMLVQPTLDMCKRLSKQKLEPACRATPAVRDKLPPPRAKDGGNSMFAKEYPGGMLMLAGANSATSLRSASIRDLFLDEVDAYPPDLDGEGDPIDLAKARTRTFPRAKRLYGGTPTIKGASRIEAGFATTDQRYYWVPCPHCGEYQTISWERMKWDPADLSRPTWMECAACGGVIEEHNKTTMLAAGEWRSSAPELASDRVVGFHLSSLYSPYGWYSWSDARDAFLEARTSVTKLKTFVNTVLGESFRVSGEVPAWRLLYGRREPYKRGVIPKRGVLVTAAVDVQRNRLEVEIRAWARRHESWSVDHIVCEGDPSDVDSAASPWRELDAILARPVPHASGVDLRIERMVVDSADNTQAVYTWVRRQDRRRVSAIRGVHTQRTPVGVPSYVDVTTGGKKLKRALRLWPVGTDVIKSELYGWLRMEPPTDGELAPFGWLHFPEYDQEYFQQLTAEELVAKTTRTGHTHYEWVKRRERNEALDLAVYNRVAAILVGVERWRDHDWDVFERQVGLHGTGEVDDEIEVDVSELEPKPPGDEPPLPPPPAVPPPPPPPKKPSIWGPGPRKSLWGRR